MVVVVVVVMARIFVISFANNRCFWNIRFVTSDVVVVIVILEPKHVPTNQYCQLWR